MNANQIDWDAGQEHAHANAFLVIHRLLRGKYILVFTLALVFGVAGGVVGYSSQKPQYKSTGQIRIQPSLPKVLFQTEQSTATRMFSSFVSSQAEFIKQGGVIQRALGSDEWREVKDLSNIRTPYDVQRRLKVTPDRRAQEVIYISFSDENPRVSAALVTAVMNSYIEEYGKEGSIGIPEIVDMLKLREDNLTRERDIFDAEILKIAGTYHTENLQPLVENALSKIQSYKEQRDILIAQKRRYEQIKDNDPNESLEPMSAEDAALDDPMIAALLTRGTELTDAREEMMVSEGLRAEHRDVKRLTSMIDSNQQRIEARLGDIQSGEKSLVFQDENGNMIPSENVLIQKINNLTKVIEKAEFESEELFKDSIALRDSRDKRADKQLSIAQVAQRLDQITTESQVEDMDRITGKISITYSPKPANAPTSDARVKMAGVGFIGASSLPVMAVLVLGYFSHRIEYSDDDILMGSGNGIIGMLPDLGDSLTDKELADASAFAVHQIRSQLQIKNHLSETQVYGVTSPAPQDGKTSMIIAIGLSFAESGDRTLLVDLDFIGRGLSVHFGHPNSPSLAESLDSIEEVDSLIHETEFAGLSILPAGFGDDERVSRLSPRSVGALISHLRTRFDTILIDSGPILASVEAAFVTPQADGMIMVVGRGQHKPLVKKAIEYVQSLEGNIIATIFNRALIQDLRQSSSSMSVHFSRQMSRQQQLANNRPGMRVGPVAGALFHAKKLNAEDKVTAKGAES